VDGLIEKAMAQVFAFASRVAPPPVRGPPQYGLAPSMGLDRDCRGAWQLAENLWSARQHPCQSDHRRKAARFV